MGRIPRLLAPLLALALAVGAPLRADAAPAAARLKIAVMELTGARGVDPGLPKLLDEELLTQLSERFEVLGRSDIASMLGFEQQKQMLGCADENTSCLAEIGGALGVRYIVTGSLGQLGGGYFISLKVLDASHSRVLGRVSETVSGKEDQLIPALQRAVQKLLVKFAEADAAAAPAAKSEANAPEAKVAGKPEPAQKAAENAPSNLLAWSGVAAGAAMVIGGAMAGVSALGTRDDIARNRANPLPDGSHVLKDQALVSSYETKAWLANGLIAGGLAVGVVSFFLRDTGGAGGDAPGVMVVPAANGLVVEGSFR